MSLPNLHNLDSPKADPHKTDRSRLLFVTVAALAAALWLVYLPRLAQQPAFVETLERVESQGVDPGALFYTDHPRALAD